MGGPYNIRPATYSGTDPDPVEWANQDVAPAIADLHLRAAALETGGGGGGGVTVANVVPDWNGTTGTDNGPAFNAAIQATAPGGTVLVKPGQYYSASTIVIDRPIDFTCGAGGMIDRIFGTRIVFAAGVRGIDVTSAPALDPTKWRIGPFQLSSLSTGAGAGNGIFVSSGHGVIDRPTVESFGSHGVYVRAGAELGGGNANLVTMNHVRAYGNYGDGIRLEGTDSNACLLMKADVVANRGWGINLEKSSSTKVIAPHADQQYFGSPGAFRDNGISNDWDWVYSELSAPFLIDVDSAHGRLDASLYGDPVIQTSGFGWQSWRITRGYNGATAQQVFRQIGTTGQKDWMFRPGGWNNGTFDIRQDTDNLTALSIDPGVTTMLHFTHQIPQTDAIKDLGSAANRWRDVYASRALVVGTATHTSGTGSPEGVVAAPVGSVYSRIDGGAGTSFYVKESGAGTAGWIAAGGPPEIATGDVQFAISGQVGGAPLTANSFTTYPFAPAPNINIGGGTWNSSFHHYTVPKTGLYLCLGGIRTLDNVSARSCATGIGTANNDADFVLWDQIGGVIRNGRQYTRLARFTVGDQVRLFIYSDGAGFDMHPSGGGQFLSLTKLAD